MARAIRYIRNDHYYFLTNRCLLGQFVMLPDRQCRRIIKGCLARAAAELDVELVCFVFMSNHFHLIARFPKCNMAEFMCRMQGQIAGRLNDHRDRSETVFPKPYDDKAILDEAVLRHKIAYVLNNPVQDRLVASAEEWPGVTSMDLHYEDDPLEGTWVDHTKWRKYRRRKGDYDRSEVAELDYEVELHYPESLDGELPDERRESLIAVVEEERDRLHRTWSTSPHRGASVVGAEALLEEFDWWDYPEQPPEGSSGRPLGIATQPEKMRSYHDKRREISKRYRRASKAWPDCRMSDFPTGTYPPSCTTCVGSPDLS